MNPDHYDDLASGFALVIVFMVLLCLCYGVTHVCFKGREKDEDDYERRAEAERRRQLLQGSEKFQVKGVHPACAIYHQDLGWQRTHFVQDVQTEVDDKEESDARSASQCQQRVELPPPPESPPPPKRAFSQQPSLEDEGAFQVPDTTLSTAETNFGRFENPVSTTVMVVELPKGGREFAV